MFMKYFCKMSNVNHLLQQAKELFNQKDFRKSIELLSRVTALDPYHHQAYYHLGLSYRYTDRLHQSLEALEKCAALKPDFPDYLSELGIGLFHLERKKEALTALNRAQELDSGNPYRYSTRAYIRSVMEDSDGAILDYKKCIELDPKDAIAHNNLGMIFEKQGKLAEAKEYFKIADGISGVKNPNRKTKKKEKKKLNPSTSSPKIKKSSLSLSYFIEVCKSIFTNKETTDEFFDFVKKLFVK